MNPVKEPVQNEDSVRLANHVLLGVVDSVCCSVN